MKRRQALGHLQKIFLGTVLLSGPYAAALEHLGDLNLPTTPDPMQKQLMDSNVEFMLARDCGTGDPCEEKYCMTPQLKAKCNGSEVEF